MDLAEALGVKRPAKRKPELVSEYSIWCPKCGYKSATWTIDGPNANFHVKKAFDRQRQEVLYPTHANHGTFTIINERTFPYAVA